MPGRKKGEAFETFDYDQAHQALVESMDSLHIMRSVDMPNIELYRDQVLSIVSSELAPLYADDEKIITGSMINNYVKQRVIPAPTRKRYSRQHLSYLLIVCTLKRVLPISQVSQLFELGRAQGVDLNAAYDELIRCLEDALKARFAQGGSPEAIASTTPRVVDGNGNPVEGMLSTLLQAAIGLVADKVYLERMLELEARRPTAGQGEGA